MAEIKAGASKVSILTSCLVPSTETSKAKTKAKTRYLKRKRLRRKTRKSSAPRKPGDPSHASSGSEEDQDDEEGIVDDADGDSIGGDRVVAHEQSIQPPKKKRKVVDEGPHSNVSTPGERHDLENKEPPRTQRTPAIPTGALSSFPLPTAPSAPPKSVLAMQGIDRALIHAELINPFVVTPLSIVDQDPYNSGLSLKTRRRLLDLGISELFAGQEWLHELRFQVLMLCRAVQTALLPFLVHHRQSLYTPYSAPRDVCVSAPTGSGKTLAYVLPILEVSSSSINAIRDCRRS